MRVRTAISMKGPEQSLPILIQYGPHAFGTACCWDPDSGACRNGFRVHPLQYPLVASVSAFGVINSLGRPLQQLVLGRRIERVEIKDAPIFIIGHWRSGTTLLHELMALDPRFTFPTTYECFAPNHFLISAWFVKRLTFLLPRRRPMDNMMVGWDRPQEDEFALCNMGVPSPYLRMLFPNEPEPYPEYFDLEDISPEDRRRWQEALLWFLRRVTYRTPKRIVLKSPPHLANRCRCSRCSPMRDSSTSCAIPMWSMPRRSISGSRITSLSRCSLPKFAGLEEYVFSCFERMYRAFEAQHGLVDPSRIYEVRYEDLVRDQIGELRKLYDHLDLGEFETVQPEIQRYLAGTKDYQTNKYEIAPELRSQIDSRWDPCAAMATARRLRRLARPADRAREGAFVEQAVP